MSSAAQIKRAPGPEMPMRKLTTEAQYRVGQCIKQFLQDGLGYVEAREVICDALISAALKETNGIKTKAAARLKISRKHLHNTLKREKNQ